MSISPLRRKSAQRRKTANRSEDSEFVRLEQEKTTTATTTASTTRRLSYRNERYRVCPPPKTHSRGHRHRQQIATDSTAPSTTATATAQAAATTTTTTPSCRVSKEEKFRNEITSNGWSEECIFIAFEEGQRGLSKSVSYGLRLQ